jgi:hypothetical protein
MEDRTEVREEHEAGPALRWIRASWADLADGQRWTLAVVVVVLVLFVGFGYRHVPSHQSFDLSGASLPGAGRPATLDATTTTSTSVLEPAPPALPAASPPVTLAEPAPAAPAAPDEQPPTTEAPPRTTTTTTAPPPVTLPPLPGA